MPTSQTKYLYFPTNIPELPCWFVCTVDCYNLVQPCFLSSYVFFEQYNGLSWVVVDAKVIKRNLINFYYSYNLCPVHVLHIFKVCIVCVVNTKTCSYITCILQKWVIYFLNYLCVLLGGICYGFTKSSGGMWNPITKYLDFPRNVLELLSTHTWTSLLIRLYCPSSFHN